jgi:uncharacterized membrane protein
VLFGVFGALVSAKLLNLEFKALSTSSSAFTSCTINSVFDCSSVASSKYSQIFGFPNMILGLVYYSTIFTFFGLLLTGTKVSKKILLLMLIPTLGGLFFSFYLLHISLFILYKICIFCLGSSISGTAIFILYNLYLISEQERTYSLRLTALYSRFAKFKYKFPVLVAVAIVLYAVLMVFAKFYYMKYFSGDITTRSIIMFPITIFKYAWIIIAD